MRKILVGTGAMISVLVSASLLYLFASSYVVSEAKYPSYDDVVEQLKQTVQGFSDIAELHEIGASVLGRKIYALKISDNVEANEKDEEEILLMGVHHGDEKVAVPIIMELIRKLTIEYSTNIEVKEDVDTKEIWIVPIINPDGYEKNQRENSNFVDLNRNYGENWNNPRLYKETDPDWDNLLEEVKRIVKKTENKDITDQRAREILRKYNLRTRMAKSMSGTHAFSEPETIAIKGLAEGFGGEVDGFYFSVSWHSFGGDILYPWSYDNFRETYLNAYDDERYRSIAQEMSRAIAKAREHRGEVEEGYDFIHPWFGGNAGYNIGGGSEDWLYQRGTFSFTIEAYGEEEGGGDGSIPEEFLEQYDSPYNPYVPEHSQAPGYYPAQPAFEYYPGQYRAEGSADKLRKVVENNLAAALVLLNQ